MILITLGDIFIVIFSSFTFTLFFFLMIGFSSLLKKVYEIEEHMIIHLLVVLNLFYHKLGRMNIIKY